MKNKARDEEFVDVSIGSNEPREWTKKEFDELDAHRRKIYEERSEDEKRELALLKFRYTLEDYLDEHTTNHEHIDLGALIKQLLATTNIRQNQFAEYVGLSPQNLNKYLSGKRRLNIDLAMKIESIFKLSAHTLLYVQSKNEILMLNESDREQYKKYNIEDLV